MKCLFCDQEIVDDNPICPKCGRRQRWIPDWKPENELPSTRLSAEIEHKGEDQSSPQDTGWKCKNCGNFNVRTVTCSNCGKEKGFVPEQSPTTSNIEPKKSNTMSETDAHDYLVKALEMFFEGGMHGESDRLQVTDEVVGYLFMAFDGLKNPEIQALAYGFLASCLELLGERDRCKEWVNKALAIDPNNVFANITNYDLKVERFAKQLNGLQTVMNMHPLTALATSITFALGPHKMEIKKYAMEVYKAYNNTISKEPNGLSFVYWIFGAKACLGIAEQLRKTGINEPYICRVIFNVP